MFINRIQYHNVICQEVFKQGQRGGFRIVLGIKRPLRAGQTPRGQQESNIMAKPEENHNVH